jgi:hypothetical protein
MKQQWKGGQEVFENGRHQGAMARKAQKQKQQVARCMLQPYFEGM